MTGTGQGSPGRAPSSRALLVKAPAQVSRPDAFDTVGERLHLLRMVRELALLDAPESPLCRPDCAGLCPICGADLNEGSCECEAPKAPSPWDVLDGLKARFDDN